MKYQMMRQIKAMSQDNLHRFCVLESYFERLVDLKFKDPSYYSDKKPLTRDEDVNSQYWTLYSEILFGRKENVQFNFSLSNEDWKDCEKSLIMNRSDIILDRYMFPRPDKVIDGSKIDVLGFIQDYRTYFISGYSASNSTKYSDLMESLSSFSYLTWIGFVISIMTIHLLLKTSCKKLKKRRQRRLESDSLFFKIISHFMKQKSMEGISTSFNQIILILILFTTFFHFVYNCLVHTDLVVAYKPFTPKSYQDIIDNHTADIDFDFYASEFKRMSKSSKDRQFYDKMNHRNLRNKPKEYIEKYYGKNNDYVISLLRNYTNILFGLHILFEYEDKAIQSINRLCSLKIHSNEIELSFLHRIHYDVYPWISSDPETDPTMSIFVKRKGFKPHVGIIRRISRARQASVQQMFNRLVDNFEDFISKLIPGYKKKDKELKDCRRYSRVVKLYDVDYSDINIKNMKWLFYIFFALIFASFIVLLYEIWNH